MRKNHRAFSQEKSRKSTKSGFIRLISGQWRGKKLPVHDKEGLRPTTDRTKETLFNWLMHDVHDANCLDCFSGSGSLGFEALSRYAKFCTFLELDSEVAKQLNKNLQSLNSNNAQVIQTNALNYLDKASTTQYNIVFIDPPFQQGLVNPSIEKLEHNNYLAENALIYIETESSFSELDTPESWSLLKQKSTGQVTYQLFQKG